MFCHCHQKCLSMAPGAALICQSIRRFILWCWSHIWLLSKLWRLLKDNGETSDFCCLFKYGYFRTSYINIGELFLLFCTWTYFSFIQLLISFLYLLKVFCVLRFLRICDVVLQLFFFLTKSFGILKFVEWVSNTFFSCFSASVIFMLGFFYF